MNLFSPLCLKELCQKYGLKPSKQYGQNYLISQRPIEVMIKAAELTKKDVVVEIGPGFGVLTLAMAPQVKKVMAFEIEKKLVRYWEEKVKEYKNIDIVWGNVLHQIINHKPNLRPELGLREIKNYKLIANLPYQITSHVLRIFLELPNKPERIIVMVQKEVAQRICAKPGEMSLLAVSVQYYGQPRIVARVSRGNFFPVPQVDSAVLFIETLAPKRLSTVAPFSDEEFFVAVRAGFAHPRKQLWHNLKVKFPLFDWKSILKEITGNEKIRAEELSVEDWEKIVIHTNLRKRN